MAMISKITTKAVITLGGGNYTNYSCQEQLPLNALHELDSSYISM